MYQFQEMLPAIQKEDGRIQITISPQNIRSIQQILEQNNIMLDIRRQEQEFELQQQSFRRRAIPFFMIAFEKYLKQLRCPDRSERKLIQALAQMKMSKQTKQLKWELGDLIRLCTEVVCKDCHFIQTFEKFLYSDSEFLIRYIKNNRKIKVDNNRNQYDDMRSTLLDQLRKPKPFAKFITKRLQNQIEPFQYSEYSSPAENLYQSDMKIMKMDDDVSQYFAQLNEENFE